VLVVSLSDCHRHSLSPEWPSPRQRVSQPGVLGSGAKPPLDRPKQGGTLCFWSTKCSVLREGTEKLHHILLFVCF